MSLAFVSSLFGLTSFSRFAGRSDGYSLPEGGAWRQASPRALNDHGRLEWILGPALGRRFAHIEAGRLLTRFKNLRTCLDTPAHVLADQGFDPRTVSELQQLRILIEDVLLTRLDKQRLLPTYSAVEDYLRFSLGGEQDEQLRVLYLDKAYGLIRDELHSRGTVDHVSVYVRQLAKRSLELGASVLVLVHNHPSGQAYPSSADFEMTRNIMKAMAPLGINVADHLIVGRDRVTSMRGTGEL